MGSQMTRVTRAELANAVRSRYHSAKGNAKRRILQEFIATTGYHEKSAIRLLNQRPTDRPRQTRCRPSLYDEAARAALVVLWEAATQQAPYVAQKQIKELRRACDPRGPIPRCHSLPASGEPKCQTLGV